MKIVLQRVKKACVMVDGKCVGEIGKGLLLLLGVHTDDTVREAEYLVDKCVNLRVFSDADDKMNLSLADSDAEVLVVSQFTLYGNCSKGRRPSFVEAAPPLKGNELYTYFVEMMKTKCRYVATGIFGAMMEVELINDGPVTLVLEKLAEGKQ
ncbi:MAG: D-tyrosyl-tRNA(Tyr) deacylase [Chitinispirillaceae bacterium]|nr:D-tyrosyl-tRNA(Tyr) deacylase [Chitinispirillaceae bacterium]